MSTIDVGSAQTVEVDYDELCGALAARDLKSLWSIQTQLLPSEPLPVTQPWLWKWATIYPLAKRAGEIVTIERGGDRRVLALANPGLHSLPFTSSTLWGAIQYLGPNESAPAHRHTPSAIRFVMVGSGVYTTVDGDACEMHPGDLILTPNWSWHDHNNPTDEPMVWFDGLDLPLVKTLESIFFENHPDERQPVRGRNVSEEHYVGVGRVDPVGRRHPTQHSPLLRYRWEETERALSALQRSQGGPELTLEYTNPITGGPAVATLGCEMTRIIPGERTASRRTTGSAVYVVLHGEGRSVVKGVEMTWGPGDVFVKPSWAPIDHEAVEIADIFSISDRPVLEALHLYRDETLLEHQTVVERFEPK